MISTKTIIFKLNNESFGIDIAKVSAIEKQHEIVTVPNSSKNIKGIINLRGDVTPVINLKAKFNMKECELTENSQLIVINVGHFHVAVMVDSVEEICDVNAEDITEMPVIAKSDKGQCFKNVAKIGQNLVIFIEPEELLTYEEKEAAKKLVDDSEK